VSQSPPRALLALARATTIVMFAVVLAGFLVTETGSAQGCGRHWPLCEGQFTPPFNLHGMVEYGHRFLSSIVGVLVLALAIWAWRRWGRRLEVRLYALLMLLFTMIQALLGAEAVLFPTSPAVLASHFGISLVALGATLALDVRLHETALPRGAPRSRPALPGPLRALVYGYFAYLFLLVYSGAYVAHTGTGMLCGTSWPLCLATPLPALGGGTWIPFLHRFGAFLAVLWTLAVYLALRPYARTRPDALARARLAVLAVLAQAFSGWYLVASGLALPAVMLHITLMVLLFSLATALLLAVLRAPADLAAPSALPGSRLPSASA